jgi:PhnB protein
MHLVGEGDEIVAQLGVGDAAFWIAPASSAMKRLDPRAIDGATSRTLIVIDDPAMLVARAVRAGAKETSPVGDEHGWRLGRIVDPFGHEWEIGKPLGPWPPPSFAGAGARAKIPPRFRLQPDGEAALVQTRKGGLKCALRCHFTSSG